MWKLSTLLLAGVAVSALTAATAPAQAGVCPATGTTVSTCNLFYNFHANGSITTSGLGGSYDFAGHEDSLIGVVNNSTKTVTSITLSGSNIFGFDGDGIGLYPGSGTNAFDTSFGSYGGTDAFFTNIMSNNGPGTVNFIGGIAPGATGYFSLEEPVSISAPPTVTGTPEPATWAMMLLGFAGLGFAGYRASRKTPAFGV
jgi:hypothetical protein